MNLSDRIGALPPQKRDALAAALAAVEAMRIDAQTLVARAAADALSVVPLVPQSAVDAAAHAALPAVDAALREAVRGAALSAINALVEHEEALQEQEKVPLSVEEQDRSPKDLQKSDKDLHNHPQENRSHEDVVVPQDRRKSAFGGIKSMLSHLTKGRPKPARATNAPSTVVPELVPEVPPETAAQETLQEAAQQTATETKEEHRDDPPQISSDAAQTERPEQTEHSEQPADHADPHEVRSRRPAPSDAMAALASVMRSGSGIGSSFLRKSFVEPSTSQEHSEEIQETKQESSFLESNDALDDHPPVPLPRQRPSITEPSPARRSVVSSSDELRPISIASDLSAPIQTQSAEPVPQTEGPKSASIGDLAPAVPVRPRPQVANLGSRPVSMIAHASQPTPPVPAPRPMSMIHPDDPNAPQMSADPLISADPPNDSTSSPQPKRIPGAFASNHNALGALAAAMTSRPMGVRPSFSRPSESDQPQTMSEQPSDQSAHADEQKDAAAPARDPPPQNAPNPNQPSSPSALSPAAMRENAMTSNSSSPIRAPSPTKSHAQYSSFSNATPFSIKRKENSISGDDKALETRSIAWLNEHLSHKSVQITNLYSAFSDGLTLIHALEHATGDSVGRYAKTPMLPVHRIDNTAVALSFMVKRSIIPSGFVTPQDVLDGTKGKILALFSHILKVL